MKLRIPPPVVCDRGSERAAAAIWDGTEHVLMGARLSAVVGRVVYHIPFFVQKAYGGHSAATGGWTERRFPKLERHQSRFRRGPRFWRGEELNLDMVVLFYLLIPFPVPQPRWRVTGCGGIGTINRAAVYLYLSRYSRGGLPFLAPPMYLFNGL